MVVGSFPHRIATRYLKFTPRSFHGKLMCMRVEAVGCHPDDGTFRRLYLSQLSRGQTRKHRNGYNSGLRMQYILQIKF